MKYTEALRKLFEVADGRPDILSVEFDRENDSFSVITNSGEHLCFGHEFRNGNNPSICVGDKVRILANDDPELGFPIDTVGTVVANMSSLGYDNPYKVQLNGVAWWYKEEQLVVAE